MFAQWHHQKSERHCLVTFNILIFFFIQHLSVVYPEVKKMNVIGCSSNGRGHALHLIIWNNFVWPIFILGMKSTCCVHLEEEKMPLIKRQVLKPVKLLDFKINDVYVLFTWVLSLLYCTVIYFKLSKSPRNFILD